MGIIHYNMTPEEQVHEVAKVKNYVHGIINKPITIEQNQKIGDIMKMREEKGYMFGTFPVLSKDGKLV